MSKTKVLFAYCHELGRCLSIDEARTEFFPESRKKGSGSLFHVAIATVMSPLAVLTIMSKLKMVRNSRLRTSVHLILTSSDVNGSNSPRMRIRTGVQTSQRLISQNEKQSKS